MRAARITMFVGVAAVLGASTTVLVAWHYSVALAPAIRSGAETLRFPTKDRCGIVVHRVDRVGGIDITVQTGMITRMGGPIDAESGAVEARVPAWARDELVPWGWEGAWQPGQRSVRHLLVRGWPAPAFAAVLEARSESPDGLGGWTVIAGVDLSPPRASPFSPGFPRVALTRLLWPGVVANTAVYAAGWFVALLSAVAGARWLRSARRRRRGQCTHCGYAMTPLSARASPAADGGRMRERCPECGRELAARGVRRG